MENFSYKKALELANISYLGDTTQSAKLTYSYENGVETYGVYLAPATLARDEKHPHINNCPNSKMCAHSCLSGAGRNKCAILAMKGIGGLSRIDQARIRKTHLFYDDRETFMQILIHEIKRAKNHAEKKGLGFAIRLNCTSDLNLETFVYQGKNIFEIFPEVQFYDYTKVPHNVEVGKRHKNYFVVLSYDGTNDELAINYLKQGGNVAVVFDMPKLPKTMWGYKVVDGNKSDVRFLDPKGCVVGLHYHKTANDYVFDEERRKNVYIEPNTPFIIKNDDKRLTF